MGLIIGIGDFGKVIQKNWSFIDGFFPMVLEQAPSFSAYLGFKDFS